MFKFRKLIYIYFENNRKLLLNKTLFVCLPFHEMFVAYR